MAEAEVEVTPEAIADRDSKAWLDLIKHAERKYQPWQDKSDAIDKLYADLERLSGTNADREFQIFWANLEVLKPSIYARSPVPVVVPRFKDRKPLPRKAADLLERSLVTDFELEDLHAAMMMARDDLATNARGVIWCRYYKDNGREVVCPDHVDRKDFLHGVARKWKEVPWVARRVWLTKKEGITRFPGEDGTGKVWLRAEFKSREDETDTQSGDGTAKGEEKAACWELWHKGMGVVVWVTPGVDEVLDISEPFLNLEGFFPCARPAYGTLQRGTMIPVPDFLYYKDQVEEINELTARVSALSEALRVRGFFAAGASEVGDAIEAAIKLTDNNAILVPISNFAALGGAGLKDSIVWLPVDIVAKVIAQLVELRKQLIDDVYQITGLSDIMRGSTDANETLGAQQLKSQYGSVRVRDKQEELVRLARDTTRIAAEIMAENFAPETLLAMSQIDDLPSKAQIEQQMQGVKAKLMQAAQDPQMIQQAQANPQMVQQVKAQAEQQIGKLQQTVTLEAVIELLRSQRLRPFVLDIETDSTIQPDENAEKERRAEFLTALGGVISQLAPMVQAQPESAPFASEVLKFAVAPFRAGRELEGVIEEFADKMKQSAQQPKPNPEQIKAEAEAKTQEAELQFKQQDAQIRAQEGQAKAAGEQQAMAFAQQKHADEMRMAREKHVVEMEAAKLNLVKIRGEIERINAQAKAAALPRPEKKAA